MWGGARSWALLLAQRGRQLRSVGKLLSHVSHASNHLGLHRHTHATYGLAVLRSKR